MNIVNSAKLLVKIFSLLGKRKRIYFIGLFGDGLVRASLYIMQAFIFKDMINAAVTGQTILLRRAIILTISLIAVVSILGPYFCNIMIKCVKSELANSKVNLFEHIIRLPIKSHYKHHPGDLISRINSDFDIVEGAFLGPVYVIVFSLIFGIGSIISAINLSCYFAIILIVLGVLSTILNTRFVKILRETTDAVQKNRSQITQSIVDLVNGIAVIKMFPIGLKVVQIFEDNNINLRKSSAKNSDINSKVVGMNFFLQNLNYIGIIAIGTILVKNNLISLGVILAVIPLQTGITYMFLNLGTFITQLQGSFSGAIRIFEIMNEPVEDVKVSKHDMDHNIENMIVFKSIQFRYDGREENALNEMSFALQKGTIGAIVGASGGGKSTILKLLLGFYSLEQGCIEVAGKDIREYSKDELREIIAYVPQDIFLFNGTIADNIKIGNLNATEEEIINAAKIANIHEVISEKPEGYNTIVGGRGIQLSGGQRQRIAIARAVLKNSPILILDEPTAALDEDSKQFLKKYLNLISKDHTVLIVTHQLQTIGQSDIIFVVDNGTLLKEGTDTELMYSNYFMRNGS